MTGVLVDSNVLLDVMTEDLQWFDWSSHALARCAEASILVINPVVYAEVSTRFATIEDLEYVLSRSMFERRDISWGAAILAGKCFVKYRRAGGGKKVPLPDLFIGAHAAVEKLDLLTHDDATYRSYFPTVRLVVPDS